MPAAGNTLVSVAQCSCFKKKPLYSSTAYFTLLLY